MFSPYQPNSCYESDYECICIIINGKTCSVPLNILSSVYPKTMVGPNTKKTLNNKSIGQYTAAFQNFYR